MSPLCVQHRQDPAQHRCRTCDDNRIKRCVAGYLDCLSAAARAGDQAAENVLDETLTALENRRYALLTALAETGDDLSRATLLAENQKIEAIFDDYEVGALAS